MKDFITIQMNPKQMKALGHLRGVLCARDKCASLWLADPAALQRDAGGERVALAFGGDCGPNYKAGFARGVRWAAAAVATATSPEALAGELERLRQQAFLETLASTLETPADAENLVDLARALTRKKGSTNVQ